VLVQEGMTDPEGLFHRLWRAFPLVPRWLRTLKPVDEQAIVEAAHETELLVTVEDHLASGGLATIVAEVVVSRLLPVRLHRIALAERWFRPALYPDVLEHEGFTGEHLAARISGLLSRPGDVWSARSCPTESD
jgi:deoxyxylulose-5-phosphate synthase